MKNKARSTRRLLKCISAHLTRPTCANKSYVLTVGMDCECGVDLNPPVKVYPDPYHRKPSDLDELLTHIALYHITELLSPSTNREDRYLGPRYKFNSDAFVEGVYVFTVPYKGQKRKWVKTK